ncbi:hypothetical protein D3C78_1614790 [compost metagenome]
MCIGRTEQVQGGEDLQIFRFGLFKVEGNKTTEAGTFRIGQFLLCHSLDIGDQANKFGLIRKRHVASRLL